MTGISRRLALALAAAALAVASPGAALAQQALKVVATTAMIADAARAIGGERVAVESLLGEGVDPHLYKPTRADVAKMLGADLILANGLALEAQFQDTFDQLARTKPVAFVGDALPKDRLLVSAQFSGKPDPHVWMDPDLWVDVTAAIRDALIAADADGRRTFERGQAAYADEIRKLSGYARGVLGSVPPDRRVLVTAHDAFNYFARAYGFEVVGIQGVSTESEAGLKRIEDVVDLVVERDIPAIFVEASVSDRNVKAVVEGAAQRGHALAIGAQIFSDSMGRPGTYEGTYVGMIDHNVTSIARALGGKAPERGLSGRLGAGS